MKSLINAINNLTSAINNLASKYSARYSYSAIAKTTTSNPTNVNITSYKNYLDEQKQQTVIISTAEHKALNAIYKAITDKGSYPDHHDHVRREISTKWPVLSKALDELVKARSYYNDSNFKNYNDSNFKNKSIWKYDK